MTIELTNQFDEQKKCIQKIIENVANKHHLNLSTTTLDNLVIHLSLCLSRELNGSYIPTSESQIYNLKNHEYYDYAKEIIQLLENQYDIQIDENQIYYTTMYLANLNLLDIDFNCEFDLCDHELEDIMDETITSIESQLEIDLKSNADFYNRIALHFYPALDRLENNKQLTSNPLKDNIQSQYKTEYQCAQIFNDIVEKHVHKHFNEHELAYIALHFGTALKK